MIATASGVLLLSKPPSISSQHCLTQLKKAHRLGCKVGHTGTLDPFATGLLPVCFGEATKISSVFLHATKQYTARLTLGVQTNTGDCTGTTIARRAIPPLSADRLDTVCRTLCGQQTQVPPMFSAKKYRGIALYKYARRNVSVERAAHAITIYQLTVRDYTDTAIDFTIHCSKGTYVRSVGEAIAKRLGTVGHLEALERSAVGAMSIRDAVSLDEASKQLPLYSLREVFARWLPQWQPITLTDNQARALRSGQAINIASNLVQPVSIEAQYYALDAESKCIAIVTRQGKYIYPKRIFNSYEQ